MLRNKLLQGMKLKDLSVGVGAVQKVYKSSYKADVFLPAFGNSLLRVPIAAMYAGNGYGMIAYPAVNDTVLIAFVGGSMDNPVIIGRLFSKGFQPPAESSDEIFIKHSSGTKVRINSDGVVHIEVGTGKKVVLDGDAVSGTINGTVVGDHGSHTHTFTLQVDASSTKLKAE